jgi:hypothetical protein
MPTRSSALRCWPAQPALHPANAVAIVRDDYRHANPRGARDLTVVCRKACQGMRTLSGLDSERRAPRRNSRKNAGGKPPRNKDRIGKGRCRIQRRRAWGSVHPKRKETEVKTKYTITLALALAIVPGGAYAGDFTSSPSARHPQIFKSTFCVAQWVDLRVHGFGSPVSSRTPGHASIIPTRINRYEKISRDSVGFPQGRMTGGQSLFRENKD